MTLDRFDRETALDDPVNATNFTTTYRADGQPASVAAPNGNTTAFAYDRLGHLKRKHTTATGSVDRALYDWTYNRAGQILKETSTISGDPTNGERTTAYEPLGRLTGSTLLGTTTTYGWGAVPNRTSVTVGAASSIPTTYDAADRPTDQNGVSNAYTSDADGRLNRTDFGGDSGQTRASSQFGLTLLTDCQTSPGPQPAMQSSPWPIVPIRAATAVRWSFR